MKKEFRYYLKNDIRLHLNCQEVSMFDQKNFGIRLRALRKEKRLVMADIAKLLGTSIAQIGDMEKGNSGTSLTRLVQLAEFFHVSTDYLLGITDDPSWRGE